MQVSNCFACNFTILNVYMAKKQKDFECASLYDKPCEKSTHYWSVGPVLDKNCQSVIFFPPAFAVGSANIFTFLCPLVVENIYWIFFFVATL